MDHHCNFLNKCIGAGNQRSFYLLLITSYLSSLLTFVLCASTLILNFLNQSDYTSKRTSLLLLYLTIFYLTLKLVVSTFFLQAEKFKLQAILMLAEIVVLQTLSNYNRTGIKIDPLTMLLVAGSSFCVLITPLLRR
jgi:hypothetical protein